MVIQSSKSEKTSRRSLSQSSSPIYGIRVFLDAMKKGGSVLVLYTPIIKYII